MLSLTEHLLQADIFRQKNSEHHHIKSAQHYLLKYHRRISIFLSTTFIFSLSASTLLLRLLSDVLGAADHCQLTLLAVFDVSTALDTMDHEILLQRLHLSFGVSGSLLSWLASFFSERSMCVVHGLSRSSWVPAPYGLPQGSVLGPLLYIIYTSDIASLLTSQAMLGQLYADDV